ncbi:MAG: hypothetical protein Q8L14_21185 [Myxococcales bacterium]|nr:hypothetical protein [Myxococcales bacterium]
MMPGLVTLLALSALDVRWLAPDTCTAPDLSLLASTSNGTAEVRITTPTPATWVLELKFLEPFQATRRLELGSCLDARRAARALLVLGLKGADAFEKTELPLAAPPLTTSDPSPPMAPSEVPPTPLVISVRLGALANVFTAPAPTPRFTLGAALRLGVLEVELTARAGVPAVFAGGPTSASAISVWPALGGELAGCFSPTFGRVRFGACGTVVGEWWRLEGQGVSNPSAGNAALVAIGGQGRVAFVLGAGFEAGVTVALRGNARRPVGRFGDVDALLAGPLGLEGAGWVGWSR